MVTTNTLYRIANLKWLPISMSIHAFKPGKHVANFACENLAATGMLAKQIFKQVLRVCEERMLWKDCTNAQAGRSLAVPKYLYMLNLIFRCINTNEHVLSIAH